MKLISQVKRENQEFKNLIVAVIRKFGIPRNSEMCTIEDVYTFWRFYRKDILNLIEKKSETTRLLDAINKIESLQSYSCEDIAKSIYGIPSKNDSIIKKIIDYTIDQVRTMFDGEPCRKKYISTKKNVTEKVCRRCGKTITKEEAVRRSNGDWDNLCRVCGSRITYLGQWRRRGIEAVEKEVMHQESVLKDMKELLQKMKEV